MKHAELPATVLGRRAIVYVRQSTLTQVEDNLESQRRQYELADRAREVGFRDVVVIDDDLGISASGTSARPGFESLVSQICEGVVGGVFCLEASRLARNGRDWHHLVELCGLVGARVFDVDGAYDPSRPNDRLLLGLKGTMSEFELTIVRRRLLDAALAKAPRGELRFPVPVGLMWEHRGAIELDPDRRVQDALRTIFRLFEALGSARKVLPSMHSDGLLFPRPAYVPGHRVTGDRRVAGLRGNNGWEFLHIAIDDRTRLAYTEPLPDEKGPTCAAFLARAAAFYRRHGIRIARVMTDNGCGYKSEFAKVVLALGAKHRNASRYPVLTSAV